MRKTLLTLFMCGAPRAALACPVCFGQSDSPLAKATNLGILAMLVVVFGVLTAFASFFVSLGRRARLAADAHDSADANRDVSGQTRRRVRPDAQEGTA